MIGSIQISNFQSHKNTKLEFSTGVNAIIGPSDSGKTAIIRALKWLVQNRPQGEAFRSSWAAKGHKVKREEIENTEVYIRLNEESDFNIHITRIRGDKDNSYICDIDRTDRLGDIFKAIRSEVPEEIEQALNLSTINLQQQLDRPFLLDESPGEVAKHFNRIAHLDVIDRGMQNVQKDIRQLDQNITSSQSQLEDLKESLTQFDYLEELEAKIQRLEQLDKTRDAIVNELDTLEKLIQRIREAEDKLRKYDKILSLSEIVDSTLELFKQRSGLEVASGELREHFSKMVDTSFSIEVRKKNLVEMEQEFKDNFPEICPLCGK